MRRAAVFVYGSLLRAEVARAVLGRSPPLQPAQLPGFRRHALRGYPFPGLVRRPGARTDGAVMHVSIPELRRLDRFEDDFYERRRIRLNLGNGRPTPAFVYVLGRQHRRLAAPRKPTPEPGTAGAARRDRLLS